MAAPELAAEGATEESLGEAKGGDEAWGPPRTNFSGVVVVVVEVVVELRRGGWEEVGRVPLRAAPV